MKWYEYGEQEGISINAEFFQKLWPWGGVR